MDHMMQDMHGSGYTGNLDKDFLSMMITHYEGAVDMARLVLIHGRDPLARLIAETSLPAKRWRLPPCVGAWRC